RTASRQEESYNPFEPLEILGGRRIGRPIERNVVTHVAGVRIRPGREKSTDLTHVETAGCSMEGRNAGAGRSTTLSVFATRRPSSSLMTATMSSYSRAMAIASGVVASRCGYTPC